MLADRLGRCETGMDDGPCTLQVPQTSRHILMRKLILVSLWSVHELVHQDEGNAKRYSAFDKKRSPGKFSRVIGCPRYKGDIIGATEIRPHSVSLALRRRTHLHAGAVATCLEQREAKGIF